MKDLDGKKDVVGHCPFRAAVAENRSDFILDSARRSDLRRFFAQGKHDLAAFLLSDELGTLQPKERLNLISALAIDLLVAYVKRYDESLTGPKPDLTVLLANWEKQINGLPSGAAERQLLDQLDQLSVHASLPEADISQAIAETEFEHPSSILLLAGINTLTDNLQASLDENGMVNKVEFLRFVTAMANTHMLDPRYSSLESAQIRFMIETAVFAFQRFKIWVSVKTRGVLGLNVRVVPNGHPQKLYSLAQIPRVGCAVLLSGQIRFLVTREISRFED